VRFVPEIIIENVWKIYLFSGREAKGLNRIFDSWSGRDVILLLN